MTGVTLSGPWYQGNTNTVIGVVAVDVDYSQITPILQQYAVDGTVTYLVETSSYDLVATSSGELPVSGTTVITCTAAKNPTVKNTCTYLTGSTFGSTWAPDGDYQATIGGVSYVMNIASITDPQTSTLAWKMIVVGLGSALPTTNYIPTLYESLDYTITDIKNRMSTVQTIPNYLEFLAGAHPSAPLDVNIIQRTDPSLTGISQQATWSAFNVFKSMGNIVVSNLTTTYISFDRMIFDDRLLLALRIKPMEHTCPTPITLMAPTIMPIVHHKLNLAALRSLAILDILAVAYKSIMLMLMVFQQLLTIKAPMILALDHGTQQLNPLVLGLGLTSIMPL